MAQSINVIIADRSYPVQVKSPEHEEMIRKAVSDINRRVKFYLDKFESAVKPGGLLIYDPNGIINPPTRTDITICKIDAINVAAQVGNAKVYNMAVMGAFLKMKPIILPENIDKGLAKCIPARYADLISLNKAAIEEGMKAVEVL